MRAWITDTPAVYVDVDGTLLIWPGNAGCVPRPGEPGYLDEPKINEPLASALRKWHCGKRVLVLWSRGGEDHCLYAAKLCRLTPDACLPKPRLAIDDSPKTVTAGERKGFVVIAPSGEFRELLAL